MATTLQSPGVSISLIDDSVYSIAAGGTVPFIVAAVNRNKLLSNGTIAPGTTTAAAGKVQLVTGRNDLRAKFGLPTFRNVGGTPIHGDETNEYGLQAAWDALNVVDRAYVLPVDIDLDELQGSATAPTRPPVNGTHWLNIASSRVGLYRWNNTQLKWESKNIYVLNSAPGSGDVQPMANGLADPRDTFGLNGDIAMVTSVTPIAVYEKIGGTWIMLGAEAHPNDFQFAPHTRIPTTRADKTALKTGDFYIKTTTPNNGTQFILSMYSEQTGNFVSKATPLLMDNNNAYDYYAAQGQVPAGSTYIQIDYEGKFNPYYHYDSANPQYSDGVAIFTPKIYNGERYNVTTSTRDIPDINLTNYPSSKVIINGVTVTLDSSMSMDGRVITARDIIVHLQGISQLAAQGLRFQMETPNRITIVNTTGKDITIRNDGVVNTNWTPNTMTDTAYVMGFRYNIGSGVQLFRASNWEVLSFTASETPPMREPEIGTLWYSTSLRSEILESFFNPATNKAEWRTYAWSEDTGNTGLTHKLYIRGSFPLSANDGDLWIDSTDVENYPNIKKYNNATKSWLKVDTADQTTINGIVFGNYTYSSPFTSNGTARTDVLISEDAPNASLYPEGILFFNMDYSTYNVKSYAGTGRWVSVAGNKPDGSPYMGRKAQRQMVTRAMSTAIINSKEARATNRFFNLIAAPNYLEVLPELNALNLARKETAFVVTTTPMRLKVDGNEVERWASNANGATINGDDGLVTFNAMSGIWAYGGLQTGAQGTQIAVSADMIALDTILRSDSTSYVWMAPAGYSRGVVNNVTVLGHVEGNEFVPAEFDDGVRDTLYINKINPIVTFPNEGNYVFGQKTLSPISSSMDRINVARLVAYVRYELDRITRPFLFQPNDAQTRQEVETLVSQFLSDIVDKRGIYDFVVQCDNDNNTNLSIDRNELICDISISPTKAIEFIYIPIRLANTGEL